MQPLQFQYALTIGSNEWILPNAPRGWDENLIEWKRSSQYHGMVKTLTLPMEFVKQGADILKIQFYLVGGLEARTGVIIRELNTDMWLYEDRYKGALDYSTFTDEGVIVSISAIDAGIEAVINNNDGQKYTISLDVPEAITVTVPAIPLVEAATIIMLNRNNPQADTFPGLRVVTNEIKSVTPSVQDVESEFQVDPYFGDKVNWFYKATINTTLTGSIKGSVGLQYNNAEYNIAIYRSDGTKFLDVFYFDGRGRSGVQIFNFELPINGDVPLGERLFLYFDSSRDGDSNQGFLINGNTFITIQLKYNTISPSTTCKALRPFDVFKQLVRQMNGNIDYPCVSRYFTNTRAKNVVMTSGDALRGLNGAGIITTFKDFFDSYYADGCIGFGIENGNATIEDFGYWYKGQVMSAKIKDLPKDRPQVTPALDYMYSKIAVGYEDPTYDQLNGKDEVCSTQYWKLPITRVDNEYNIISKYRADIHGIEIARINLDGRTEADNSKGDNDVFLIRLNDDGSVQTANDYGSVSGVLTGEQTYNIDLWPKHMLLRHAGYLSSILDKQEGAQIRFTSGLKNYTASAIGGGTNITENENIDVSSLGAKIFLPYIMTITTDYPVDMLKLLDANPTGYISFPYNGVTWQGFNESGTVDVSKRSEREFKLLLTPGNDLNNLVNV